MLKKQALNQKEKHIKKKDIIKYLTKKDIKKMFRFIII